MSEHIDGRVYRNIALDEPIGAGGLVVELGLDAVECATILRMLLSSGPIGVAGRGLDGAPQYTAAIGRAALYGARRHLEMGGLRTARGPRHVHHVRCLR